MEDCKKKTPFRYLGKHFQQFHKISPHSELYATHISKPNRTFPSEKLSFVAQKWAEIFYKYLLSLDGGNANPEAATQHKLHLRQILNGIKIFNIVEIVTPATLDTIRNWFVTYLETHEASSAITYLSTLINFYKFLLGKNITGYTYESFEMIRIKLNKWKTSFKKLKMGKLKYEVPNINASYIIKLLESKPIFQSKKLALAFHGGRKVGPTQKEQITFRCSLITLTALRNSCRSCNLYNMTLDEFLNAKKVESDGMYYVISVSNHKTVAEHGPADIVLDEPLYQFYQCYNEHYKSSIIESTQKNCNFIFISTTGKKLNPSDVSKSIATVCKIAKLDTIGTSTIRKLVTTEIHDNDRAWIPLIAAHLKHHVSTAERNFKLLKKSEARVETSKHMLDTLKTLKMKKTSKENSCATSSTGPPDASVFDIKHEPHDVPSTGKSAVKPRGQPFFTIDERNHIRRAFQTYIEKGVVPTAKIIKDVVSSNQTISMWTDEKQSVVKIRGCLQNFRNKFLKK